MTLRGVGFGRRFPRAWLVPIGALTVLLGVAVTGRFSRSIAADLIAWWPVWLGLAISAYLVRDRKIGQLRVSGLVPLAALVFVGLFAWGHLAGWSIMPSAAQRLVGPDPTGLEDASIEAEIDGVIEVSGGSEFLYRVEPIKRGGRVGIPDAHEQVIDNFVSVVLQPPLDPGLYSYAGWALTLSPVPRWSLTLGGALDANLSELTVESLEIGGSGVVTLGEADLETGVTVTGSFRLVVPQGVAARVVGQASVPDTWTPTIDGATSPGGGDGWVISVMPGATLRVVEG
ncbi:MAG: hypothetical protein ACRDU9_08850 [Acidimicrobiia bacterium]